MYGESLTPTQRAAHERSRAFRNRIETLALKLKVAMEAPVPKIVEEVAKKPERPEIKVPWFAVLHEIEPTPRSHPSITTIQNAVCAHYKIRRDDMLSQRRTANITFPRQVAAFLCKELTPFSLPILGRKFGYRDHTTILFSVKKIARLIADDDDLAATINSIREGLMA